MKDVDLSSLREISGNVYAEKIAPVMAKNYDLLVWMVRDSERTLAFTFCSELEIGILQIRSDCDGGNASSFYMGSLNGMVKTWHSLVSS